MPVSFLVATVARLPIRLGTAWEEFYIVLPLFYSFTSILDLTVLHRVYSPPLSYKKGKGDKISGPSQGFPLWGGMGGPAPPYKQKIDLKQQRPPLRPPLVIRGWARARAMP